MTEPTRTMVAPSVRRVMQGNRKKDTRPELFVRKLVFALGYRYRLHVRSLPGTPDLVFPGREKVIFVHGCFWHQHSSSRCTLQSHPKSNLDYWGPKLERNITRHRKQAAALRRLGWSVLVVWECELGDSVALQRRLKRFLG